MSTKDRIATVALFLLSLIFVSGVSRYTPIVRNLEHLNYDFMLSILRDVQPAPPDVAIVAIDQQSIKYFAEDPDPERRLNFPWPRWIYGLLIQSLEEAGARAVIFDVIFDVQQDPQNDQEFANAIANAQIPIVLAGAVDDVRDERFTLVQQLLPIEPLLEAGAQVGLASIPTDEDSVVRSALLSLNTDPTLSSMAYEVAYGGPPELAGVPVFGFGEDPRILINFIGPARTFTTVSFYQALLWDETLPQGTLNGKVVFVGRSEDVQEIGTTSGEADLFPTPFSRFARTALFQNAGVEMAGVEIHANAYRNLVSRNFLSRASDLLSIELTLVLALLVTLATMLFSSIRLKLFVALSLMTGFLVMCWIVFTVWGIWVLAVEPLLVAGLVLGTNIVYQYRMAEKERVQVRRALKGYVSGQVLGKILKDPASLELGGVQVEATVLFSDIAGFSKISEKITPKELAALLNDYFTQMGDAIMNQDGMINKYIGDAIMAIWGAPLPNERHALQACRAAVAMKRIIDQIPDMDMRIGLNTGQMVAGNLGHQERMEYTVIGDAVNLASRLEGANKTYGSSIMISEFTRDLVRDDFLTRELDRIRVMGKEQPVRVFEVIASSEEEIAQETRDRVESYEELLDAYHDRDWQKACDLADAHLERYPNDLVVKKVYVERCRSFLNEPPPDDWDGVYTMLSK